MKSVVLLAGGLMVNYVIMVFKYGTFRVLIVLAAFGIGLSVLLMNPDAGASPLRWGMEWPKTDSQAFFNHLCIKPNGVHEQNQ